MKQRLQIRMRKKSTESEQGSASLENHKVDLFRQSELIERLCPCNSKSGEMMTSDSERKHLCGSLKDSRN